MPYDLDLQSEPHQTRKKPGLGCAIAGWSVFLIVVTMSAFFGYRVWTFVGQIRRGELVELPQFNDRFTAASGTSGGSSVPVDRAVLEGGDDPSSDDLRATPAAEEPVLTVVQFADFECPYSKEEATVVRTLMTKYGSRVRFVFRDFPLTDIHPNAMQAALAAECAREQQRFWAYHDKLYVNSPVLDYQSLLRYGDEVGLDARQFQTCLADERYKEKVLADADLAKTLKIRGTPTFFFNGQRVEGAIPTATFDQLINRFLAK